MREARIPSRPVSCAGCCKELTPSQLASQLCDTEDPQEAYASSWFGTDQQWFCIDCNATCTSCDNKEGLLANCENCWRSFHLDCIPDHSLPDTADPWFCGICVANPPPADAHSQTASQTDASQTDASDADSAMPDHDDTLSEYSRSDRESADTSDEDYIATANPQPIQRPHRATTKPIVLNTMPSFTGRGARPPMTPHATARHHH